MIKVVHFVSVMFDVSCHDHEGVKIIMTEFCPILMSYEIKKVDESSRIIMHHASMQ